MNSDIERVHRVIEHIFYRLAQLFYFITYPYYHTVRNQMNVVYCSDFSNERESIRIMITVLASLTSLEHYQCRGETIIRNKNEYWKNCMHF
jgi:hypothetical protein